MSDLVTGEAVALDLQHATLASRCLAFAIDVLFQATVLAILLTLILTQSELDSAALAAASLTTVITVLVGYPVLFETLSRGRTLGKLAIGLRVVRDDGGPVGFRQALVRGLAGFFVDFWALGLGGFIALVVSLSSASGKRVGDYLAGTIVIRVRAPGRTAQAVPMPQHLAEWAASLDLSGLPTDLSLAVRQYLTRFGQLRPVAQQDLGNKLAGQVADHIGTPPPPGVAPWDYLAAVLAERRAREQARTGLTAQPVSSATQPPGQQGTWRTESAPSPEQPAPHESPHDGPFAPPS